MAKSVGCNCTEWPVESKNYNHKFFFAISYDFNVFVFLLILFSDSLVFLRVRTSILSLSLFSHLRFVASAIADFRRLRTE